MKITFRGETPVIITKKWCGIDDPSYQSKETRLNRKGISKIA